MDARQHAGAAPAVGDLGGTMRLGAYPACSAGQPLCARSTAARAEIRERHRHRYEVNINYKDRLEKAGMLFSGMSPDGALPEIVEIPDHPWFVGVQFHPELKSKPFDPHPLFTSLRRRAVEQAGWCDRSCTAPRPHRQCRHRQ